MSNKDYIEIIISSECEQSQYDLDFLAPDSVPAFVRCGVVRLPYTTDLETAIATAMAKYQEEYPNDYLLMPAPHTPEVVEAMTHIVNPTFLIDLTLNVEQSKEQTDAN